MAVFFWILIGLTWLGGIISMLTASFHKILEDFSSQSCFFLLILNLEATKGSNGSRYKNVYMYLQVPKLFLAREKQGQLESGQKRTSFQTVQSVQNV